MDMRPLPKFKGPEGQEDMPFLLLPGPVTTSQMVRFAMMADWSPVDQEFRDILEDLRQDICALAGADESFSCVPVAGSGSVTTEAALGTFAPANDGKTLVIANGIMGDRAADILERLRRPYIKIDKGDLAAPIASEIQPLLDADRNITHVWVAHCETTSGIINPIAELAAMVKSKPRTLIVDATASLGALPVNMIEDRIDILVSASSLCLEAPPGLGFVVAKTAQIESAKGRSHSPALDVYDEYCSLRDTGNLRSDMPPTHVIAAARQALREFHDEGGLDARHDRYRRNAIDLRDGLKRMGLSLLVPDAEAGPIVQTVLAPRDPAFVFDAFAISMRAHGFAVRPGQTRKRQTFQIATSGNIDQRVIARVLSALEEAFNELGVSDAAPALEE